MKIAVTGGTGFIGQWFLRLLPPEHHALVLSRSRNGTMEVAGRQIQVRQTDYSLKSLVAILETCEAVLHLGAGRQSKDPNAEHNLRHDLHVFQACELAGISNLVFASSRMVYGRSAQVPWQEDHPVTPENPYALAKAQSELAAEFFNRTRGMAIKSLRLAQVLGLGEIDSFLVTVFLKRGYLQQPLEVSVGGEIRREYIYVKDVAAALLTALQHTAVAGIFNLGSGWDCSILELAEEIHRIFGIAEPVKFKHPLRQMKEDSRMDSSRFRATFGWMPRYSLPAALEDVAHDLQQSKLEDYFGLRDH